MPKQVTLTFYKTSDKKPKKNKKGFPMNFRDLIIKACGNIYCGIYYPDDEVFEGYDGTVFHLHQIEYWAYLPKEI